MKIIKFTALFLLGILCILFMSCSDNIDPQLVGKWEKGGYVYEFKRNGNLYVNEVKYKYETNGDNLRIYNSKKNISVTYKVTDDGVNINGCNLFPYTEEKKDYLILFKYLSQYSS